MNAQLQSLTVTPVNFVRPAKRARPNFMVIAELEARWQNAACDLEAARKQARTYRTRFLLLVPAVGVVAFVGALCLSAGGLLW